MISICRPEIAIGMPDGDAHRCHIGHETMYFLRGYEPAFARAKRPRTISRVADSCAVEHDTNPIRRMQVRPLPRARRQMKVVEARISAPGGRDQDGIGAAIDVVEQSPLTDRTAV